MTFVTRLAALLIVSITLCGSSIVQFQPTQEGLDRANPTKQSGHP